MAIEKCTNYDTCEKYGLYGACSCEDNGGLHIPTFCDVYQKQVITILSSIDEKLSALLQKQDE